MGPRSPHILTFATVAILAASGAASAQMLTMPDMRPQFPASAFSSQPIERPWQAEQPQQTVHERPIGEIVAAKLGIVRGSAELFRYQVESAPSSRTTLDGVVDGGGVKLKLTW
jgi:hypothetical protein